VEFLKLAVKSLGFTGVDFYSHKVTDKSFFNVKGVVTRALEDAPETLDRVEHFLPEGGLVILLKGPDADGDIGNLTQKNRDNYSLLINRQYNLPGTGNERRLLVFEKKTSGFRKIYKIMKNENETRGIAVSSPDNKTFKEVKKLISGDGVKKTGIITLSGKKIIKDYIPDCDISRCRLVLPDDYIENDAEFEGLITRFYDIGGLYVFKKGLFNEIDLSNNRAPVLVTDMPVIEDWDGSINEGCNPVVPFQDPANVGAAVRSAAGFGIKQIILARGAANPFHPKSIRASAGAVFKVKFVKGPAIDELSDSAGEKFPIVSLDKDGTDIGEFSFPEKFFLIPGPEGQGLPQGLRMNSVSIPVSDDVESLNATVALSLFFYEWSKNKKKLT
jgi:16S rRNA (guanine527-N7)-methyltransferase